LYRSKSIRSLNIHDFPAELPFSDDSNFAKALSTLKLWNSVKEATERLKPEKQSIGGEFG